MRTRQTTWLSLSLITALGLAPACSDDDDKDVDNTPVDAGTGSDAGATKDASTPAKDSGPDVDAGGATDAGSTADKTIVELVVANPDFESLEAAVIQAELADTLSGAGPFTVFAPTDDAFDALLAALKVKLTDLTKDELAAVLTYHVVPGAVKSTDLTTGPVKTVSGLSMWVSVDNGVTVNEIKVTTADIIAKNGVIHVIEEVIVPPDIVEFAGYAGFSSLVGAASKFPDIVDALQGDGPLTVFAPTNAAFANLTSTPPDDVLKNVLLYHVVGDEVLSTELMAGSVPTLLTGKSLTIALPASGPTVNGAKIGPADLVVTNGVIHVVDTVLIPPS